MDIFIVLIIYRRLRHHIQYVSGQAKARLNYIRILIDTVYTYSHQPELLQKHLQKEMSIKKLLAYHVIDNRCDRLFSARVKVNSNDQLLYMLHKEGFTAGAMYHIRVEQPQFGICQMPPNKQETACGDMQEVLSK